MARARTDVRASLDWEPPRDWVRIETVDAHTEGEPLRVIIAGYPELQGSDLLAKRRHAKAEHDRIRKMLMWEPRGHADMYGCLIVAPVTAEADFGVLFLHNEGYSSMCGHGIIAVTRIALETGMLPMEEPVTQVGIDTPAGFVTAFARVDNGVVRSVFFRNVPSFVVALDAEVHVPGIGPLRYDLAFGGAFYAYVRADDAGVRCTTDHVADLIEKGMAIKHAVMAQRNIEHPVDDDLGFLYGTIFVAPPESRNAHSRNVCIFAEGEVDRSPTGTGVSGRAAIHFARGEIRRGDPVIIESIIGSRFSVVIRKTTTFGPYPAVVPEVEGRTFVTGRHSFFLDPDDPFGNGFLLR